MATNKRFCKDCGIEITDTQTVYSSRCGNCQEKMRHGRGKIFLNEKREKRNLSAPRRLTDLGTTDFGPHRKKDFEKEAKAIKKEIKRLGFKGVKKNWMPNSNDEADKIIQQQQEKARENGTDEHYNDQEDW